jgi:hypothetical protein
LQKIAIAARQSRKGSLCEANGVPDVMLKSFLHARQRKRERLSCGGSHKRSSRRMTGRPARLPSGASGRAAEHCLGFLIRKREHLS